MSSSCILSDAAALNRTAISILGLEKVVVNFRRLGTAQPHTSTSSGKYSVRGPMGHAYSFPARKGVRGIIEVPRF